VHGDGAAFVAFLAAVAVVWAFTAWNSDGSTTVDQLDVITVQAGP